MSDLKLALVHTSCRECVFAEFEDKKQTGCRLNKLADYEKANTNIVEAFDDNGTEFKIINGKVCLFFRNEAVMEGHARDTWEDIVKLQTKIAYQAIVFVEKDDNFVTVNKAIRNLQNQDVRPNMVTIINKQYPYYYDESDKYITPSKLLALLSNSNFHRYSLKNVYNTELTDRDHIDIVFDGTKKLPYPFYVVFRANFDIPHAFSKELNDAILIDMLQLGFGSPIDDLSGMIVNRVAHQKHAGNSFHIPIEEKILKTEEEGERFIFKSEEVCPCLKQ